MNLNFFSSSTFSRVQNSYAVPSIRDMWDKMKEVVWKVLRTMSSFPCLMVLLTMGKGHLLFLHSYIKMRFGQRFLHFFNVLKSREMDS